ncbi:DMT family transporter [Nakamurella flavida]|uniref:DMT family transporter n=1 Tax=Nakamurella flavida TaxID=363630 RepID=A0A938YN22_9ACTN|nr:DMT family transporter [Nakamurella flavida]MBM9477566.1 DMT family transporter [Nakamurella flavida]MDP9779114.1 drug/metabolite transporter (DMT)-like permease [Nakamurella flavida]
MTAGRGALTHPGVQAALVAAVLFGAGTPLAKQLLGAVDPWLLAGLLYTGSGIGLGLYRVVRRSPQVRLTRAERWPLAGAVVAGGMLAPVLLMVGLTQLPATGASLLLNAEGVFTAVLAWVVFRENVDRRVALGMLLIVAGAVVLTVAGGVQVGSLLPSLAVLGACLCWGIDNNLTRRVALTDASFLAAVKGLVAGPVNLLLAFTLGAALPPVGAAVGAMAVGLVAYGVSLVLFIVGLRHVGTARAGAYFSVAPFFGAVLAVVLGEAVTWALVAAGLLMAVGVWLHLQERHDHPHTHEVLTHEHWHTHDDHHDHEHGPGDGGAWDGRVGTAAGSGRAVRHRHEHTHPAQTHSHPHYPDSHHPHRH